LNGAVSKTVVRRKAYRGFESHPLRWKDLDPVQPLASPSLWRPEAPSLSLVW
jgi:hypothetical protein